MPTNSVLGNSTEASIDQVNIWMRSTPWYQAQMRAWGQDPGHPTLKDWQSQQIKRLAQANGVVVDEGHVELDDHGNFNPIGHKLRNTLIVAGIAAASIATMGAAGVFSGGAAAAGSGAAAGALPAGVTLEGTAAGLGGASTAVGAGAAGTVGAAGAGGLSATSLGLGTTAGLGTAGATAPLATYGLGTSAVGGLAPGLAPGASYAAHLGGAGAGGAAGAGLSYADIIKGVVPTAGNIIGGLIQAKAAGTASAEQQKYLEEALAYQKESDAYNRTRQATLDAQEVSRYGDYQGRIAPFIANGVTSNDRMTALLGLPARAPGAGGGSGSSGPPASQRVATDPATQAAIRKELQAVNSSDDPAGWDEYLAAHGDSAAKNWDYWKHRIDTGEGVGRGYAGAPAPSGPTPAAPTASASVQMRAPDGSVKTVPADQVDFYTARGATRLQGAA